jgi:hypothetical protein
VCVVGVECAMQMLGKASASSSRTGMGQIGGNRDLDMVLNNAGVFPPKASDPII